MNIINRLKIFLNSNRNCIVNRSENRYAGEIFALMNISMYINHHKWPQQFGENLHFQILFQQFNTQTLTCQKKKKQLICINDKMFYKKVRSLLPGKCLPMIFRILRPCLSLPLILKRLMRLIWSSDGSSVMVMIWIWIEWRLRLDYLYEEED